MVFHGVISPEVRAYVRLMHSLGLSQRQIAENSNVSRSSVQRICKSNRHCRFSRRQQQAGRKRILGGRQERLLQRNLLHLRRTEGTFTAARLRTVCGLTHVSERTIRRVMNRMGYRYRQDAA